MNEYNQVTNQANQVASAPLQQYQGQIVAGTTPEEQSAYNTIDNAQGITAPYTGVASNLVGQATQNINPNTVTAQDIQNYESPYIQGVLNSTVAEENNQDAQQQAQLQGNAVSSGAWGGDRSAVAQGILGGQQALANNATNAGILNTGYTTAEQEANTQQQAALGAQEASQYLQESGGALENQLGTSALANTLTGAGAQLNAGQLQQQQAQAELNVPYEQFLQEEAYPFQTTGWLGNIAEGIGSNEGGSSTSSTTQPSEGLFGLSEGGAVQGDGIIRAYYKGGMKHGRVIAHHDTGGPASGNATKTVGNQTYTWNNSSGIGMPTITSANAMPSSPVSSTGITTPFTANIAPTYAQFKSNNSVVANPYTGGIVAGLNPSNQEDLNSIYSIRAKKGGGIIPHRDAGGITPLAQTVGQNANPFQQNTNNNYSQMSIQQLQQLSERFPAGSMQGQAIQMALKQKEMLPNVGTSPNGINNMKRGGIVQHFDDGGAQTGNPNVDTLAIFDPDGQPDNQSRNYAMNSPLPQTNITTNSEGLPSPTPPINAIDHPANSDYEKEMPTPHQANPWLSVAAGVLGTLAGRSRNPLVDIGQGGLIGINNYAGQQAQAEKQNYEEGSFHQNAQKLMDERAQTQQQFAQEKQNEADTNQYRQADLGIKQQELQKPIFDKYGNPWQINPQTKTYQRVDTSANLPGTNTGNDKNPSINNNPRDAAIDILNEEGIQVLPVAPNDSSAFKAQQSYQNAGQVAQSMLDTLNHQKALVGTYTSGPRGAANTSWLPSAAGIKYGTEELAGANTPDLAARQQAEKDANTLAMQQTSLLKNARPGLRMIQFSGTTVPNPNMTDKAQTELIGEYEDKLNQQVQRGQISSIYSGLHPKNVDAIINNYETKNPITLPDGSRNSGWMPYKTWIANGRPDTTQISSGQQSNIPSGRPPLSSFMSQ